MQSYEPLTDDWFKRLEAAAEAALYADRDGRTDWDEDEE